MPTDAGSAAVLIALIIVGGLVFCYTSWLDYQENLKRMEHERGLPTSGLDKD